MGAVPGRRASGFKAKAGLIGVALALLAPLWRVDAVQAATTAPTTYYFAEGYTGSGFHEILSILTPSSGGPATIDYYLKSGTRSDIVLLLPGQVTTVDVNRAVGPDQTVSVKVTLPSPGVVERTEHFNNGRWRGTTDKVGVSSAATEWDFAEGSTLTQFSEYLTLQNPNPNLVTVDLNYMTDRPTIHPTKTLQLPASSRTTVPVFLGNQAPNTNCEAASSCGIGGGFAGVSVQVKSRGLPIVAERPFYVNGFSFGFGPISDGHDAFGANGPSIQWDFAEGTTLPGFNEYLTLQNPTTTDAGGVYIDYYMEDGSTKFGTYVDVPPQSRVTVPVFDSAHGVGPGVNGVSIHVVSDIPIVAERPIYVYHDFGSGVVAGATDDLGTTWLPNQFLFSAASTVPGVYDYLTIESVATTTTFRIDYFVPGGVVTRQITINHWTRRTVKIFDPVEGVGPGQPILGIVATADGPSLVEKPTYSSNATTYGASDTRGASPPPY